MLISKSHFLQTQSLLFTHLLLWSIMMFALELTLSEACLLCTFRSETLINFYISCSGCCLFIRRTCSSCHFDFNGTTLTIFTNECYYPYYLLAFNLKCVDFQGNLYSSLLLWKFQLSLVNLFYFFRLREPPPPPTPLPLQGISLPSVWGVWILSGTTQGSLGVSLP